MSYQVRTSFTRNRFSVTVPAQQEVLYLISLIKIVEAEHFLTHAQLPFARQGGGE